VFVLTVHKSISIVEEVSQDVSSQDLTHSFLDSLQVYQADPIHQCSSLSHQTIFVLFQEVLTLEDVLLLAKAVQIIKKLIIIKVNNFFIKK
jgi:hypothetical protein